MEGLKPSYLLQIKVGLPSTLRGIFHNFLFVFFFNIIRAILRKFNPLNTTFFISVLIFTTNN